MKALEAATRTRGGSATMTPNYVNPSHGDQARPNKVSSSSYPPGQDDDCGLDSHGSYQNSFIQEASVGYHSDFATQGGYNQQNGNNQYQANHNGNGHEFILSNHNHGQKTCYSELSTDFQLQSSGQQPSNVRNNFSQHADSSQQHSSYQQHVDAQKGHGHHNVPGQQNRSARHTGSRLERLMVSSILLMMYYVLTKSSMKMTDIYTSDFLQYRRISQNCQGCHRM
jgi:hypothetical protein